MSDDFYQVLRARIRGLESFTAGSRGTLYRELNRSLDEHIANSKPPLTRQQARELQTQFNVAAEQIENEFVEARASGKRAPDWAWTMPVTPADERPIVEDVHRLEADDADQGLAAWNAEQAQRLADQIWFADAHRRAPRTRFGALLRNVILRLKIINTLLRRQLHTHAGTERLGYMWVVVEPLIQITVVVGVYWMLGRSYIANMPAVPFAIIGISGWLMMRMMLSRVSAGLGSEYVLCTFPVVQPLDIKISKALFYGMTYSGVMVVSLFVVWYFDLAPLQVKDPLRFIGYWVLLWCFSFGSALCFGRLLAVIPAAEHLLVVIFRALVLTSGVVFVSEQLPRDIRVYVLWNPLLHGLQLLRSAFFVDYESTDASQFFFVTMTIVMLTFGVMLDKANYREAIAP